MAEPDDRPPPTAPDPTPPRRKAWLAWLKWGVALLVLGCVAWAVAGQLREADFSRARLRPLPIVAATVALVAMYFSLATSERLLLAAFTGRWLPWRDVLPAAWVPMAGKFVPGKVAAATGAIVLLKRLGVPAATALGVFVLLDAMPVLTGTILGSTLLTDPAVRDRFAGAPLVFGLVLVGGLIALSPPVFRGMTGLALRLMRRPPLPRVPRWRDYVGPLGCSLWQWATNGLAVWLALRAVSPAGPTVAALPHVTAITALVMCLSYFGAFLTPSGLGVREGVFIPLLMTLDNIDLPAATAAAILMRLLHTGVELGLCGLGLWMLRLRARRILETPPT